MKQKGFATIFGLCMILVVALIVRGIQESEANHAREVLNFEFEQALQSAAESGVIEAAEYVRKHPDEFPVYDGWPWTESKKKVSVKNKTLKKEEKSFKITVEVWVEHGNIKGLPSPNEGVYLMGRAMIKKGGAWGEDIYRLANAYFLDDDPMTINFMELP